MSTILKALKKLEHELPDESDRHPGARTSTTRETLGRRAKRFIRFHKRFWLLIGVISLAAAAWVVHLALFSDARKSVPTARSGQPDKIIKKGLSARQPEKTNALPAQVREGLAEKPTPVARTPKKAFKRKVSRKTVTSAKRAKPSNARQPSLPPKILESKPVSVKPLEDSTLKLQAISWSENPDNRIAVINGNIMREGESIEGFRIIQIGQDDVVVRSGQNERKLVFGFK